MLSPFKGQISLATDLLGGTVLKNHPIRITQPLRVIGFLLPTLLLLWLNGCAARVGPKTLAHDRFDYSAAITQSWKEQMLLNMVKLRYMDPPMFLDVQQVVQQYTREGSGSQRPACCDRAKTKQEVIPEQIMATMKSALEPQIKNECGHSTFSAELGQLAWRALEYLALAESRMKDCLLRQAPRPGVHQAARHAVHCWY
jgi:hypothetical protein